MIFEKNIFLLWLQGWDKAPWLQRQVLESWIINNPDWNVILIDQNNLVNYVKDILNSTYKVTRIKDYSEKSEKIPYEIYNFRQVLVKAKEYLIIGNLQGAVEILKLSNIDDNEIDIWVEDASKLSNIQEKLRLLESQLLDIVGEISD